MSDWDDADDVRPFLRAPQPSSPAPERADHLAAFDDPGDDGLRPYAITGGRTGRNVGLNYETNVVLSDSGRRRLDDERAERRAITLRVQHEALSVVEIAVHLELALAVVLVLAADLIDDGILASSTQSMSTLAPQDDVELILEVMAGVLEL
jgi:hypothetical protein